VTNIFASRRVCQNLTAVAERLVLFWQGRRSSRSKQAKPITATILGTPYMTGYEPIKDSSGAQIGVYYVGYKK
jgi:methyl-accepting chemotaxis protein